MQMHLHKFLLVNERVFDGHVSLSRFSVILRKIRVMDSLQGKGLGVRSVLDSSDTRHSSSQINFDNQIIKILVATIG